jgi:histidinol-phosphate/aromatic aminotransferase/cobyric acid decarboxylase-like protein
MPSPPVLLDCNENPLGPSPAAVRLIREHLPSLHRYPRQVHELAVDAVARCYGVDPAQVLLTAGIDEATDLLLLEAGHGWCFVPGFNGYWQRADALGVPLERLELDGGWRPTVAPAALGGGGVVLLAQPANPTGNYYGERWLQAVCRRPVLVAIDETYVEFSWRGSFLPLLDSHHNVVVFKSFSKLFGLAGLRLGALFGPEALIARLGRRSAFRSVDALSLHGVIGCLEDRRFLRDVVEHVRTWRPRYVAALQHRPGLLCEPRETEANFVLARCAPGVESAQLVASARRLGVHLRDCGPFGLPGWIRASVGSSGALAALDDALRALAASGNGGRPAPPRPASAFPPPQEARPYGSAT